MCQLLAIPEYLLALLRLPRKTERVYNWIERCVNICGSLFVLMVTLQLTVTSIQLESVDGWCVPAEGSDPTPVIRSQERYGTWGKAIPTYLIMLYYLVFDIIFIAFAIWFEKDPPTCNAATHNLSDSSRQSQDDPRDLDNDASNPSSDVTNSSPQRLARPVDNWQNRPFTKPQLLALLCGTLHAALVLLSLIMTIHGLTSVGDEDQRKWSFGQMVAMASVSLATGSILLQYCLGSSSVDANVPRYLHWRKKCNLHDYFLLIVQANSEVWK